MSKQTASNLPKRTPLSKESVVVAAVQLADIGGLESLSMRKLGKVLGVEGMALYHHFANKEDLIDSMVDSVHAEIQSPQNTTDWQTALRRRSVSYVHALSRHPWAALILESRTTPGPASLRLIDATVECLLKAGFKIGSVAHAVSVLDAYTIGFAPQLRSPTKSVQKEAQMGQDIMAQFPFDLYPYLGQLITEHVTKAGYRSMAEFEFGLDLILEAIARLEPAKKA